MTDREDDQPWPVLVVSLPDAHARRQRIEAQLEAHSIPFSFVDAIDGRAGLPACCESMIDRPGTAERFGRALSDAEYACALSHRAIYRRIIDQGLPGAIVLEDDAIMGPGFAEFLRLRGCLLSDLVQLDHLHGDVWRFERGQRLGRQLRLVEAASNTSLTTGYSISRQGAAYILDHSQPLRGPADWPCDVMALKPMLAVPRVVDHPEVAVVDSAIEAERAARQAARPKGKHPLRFFRRGYWPRWWFKRLTRRVS